MIVTNDAQRAERLMCLRVHGSKLKYYHKVIGGNFRLDAIQAAIVLAKLPHLDGWTASRQRNAKRYDQLFFKSGLEVADSSLYPIHHWQQASAPVSGRSAKRPQDIFLPSVVTDRHIFNQYVIRVSQRDQLKAALQQKGIGTEVYYPVPLHLQECFASLGYEVGAFPESESAAKETLALPVHPELSEEQAGYVVDCIRDFFAMAGQRMMFNTSTVSA